jgi:hypothetical protein
MTCSRAPEALAARAQLSALRSQINRKLIAAQHAVRDAGALRMFVYTDPPAIGGRTHQFNVFSNLFENIREHALADVRV